jgi:DNA polymerase delta subunit 4
MGGLSATQPLNSLSFFLSFPHSLRFISTHYHLIMSSSQSNTKRTRSSNSSTLKQGTLAFPTAKRTGSSASSTPKAKKPVTRTKSPPSPVQVEAIDSSSSSSSISSESEERIESDEYVDTPARAVSSSEQKKASKAADKGKTPLRSRGNAGGSAIDLRADNPGKWRKHYGEVREKMGNLEPSKYPLFVLSRRG